jgi:pimeloyl-[acyl-carrier protein] methyl ester esterase
MKHEHVVLLSGWAHFESALDGLVQGLVQEGVAGCADCETVSAHALLQDHGGPPPAACRPLPATGGAGCSAYAASLAARLSACRQPAILVGWSMGGLIALETAIWFPRLVGRLVLLSAAATFCATASCPWGAEPASVRAMLLGLRRDREATLRRFFAAAYGVLPLAGPAPPSEGDALPPVARKHYQRAADLTTEELTAGLRYLLTIDLRGELPRLRLPTLILHGRQDQILPWQASDVFQAHIAASRRLLVEGNHGLAVTAPGLVLPALRRFVGEGA